MEVVEIRDLDGPNLFRLEPVIKIGLKLDADDDRDAIIEEINAGINAAHDLVGEQRPTISTYVFDRLDEPALVFDWHWRHFAVGAARFALGEDYSADDPASREALLARLRDDREARDAPLWVRDAERSVPTVGITGTNGKTTTTRLIAHIAMRAGRSVGWSSSTGVYLNGKQVLEGDYSGPGGARRVLEEPTLDLAVLETARGGLLQRGLAYESNDISVFLNVTADHLSLHGIDTVETLARVKGVVVRVTRPQGLVVLNADDPLVLAFRDRVKAPVVLISQSPASEAVQQHIARAGKAIVREGDEIAHHCDGQRSVIARVADIPIAFGGAAPFMVENAMAASGAALGLGFSLAQVADGLTSFRSDSTSNKGRLNVFDVGGCAAVIDYAHNDVGLLSLAKFSNSLIKSAGGKLHLIVGTAGDRRDEDFLALGRIARQQAQRIYLKDTPGYLRGRGAGEMLALMQRGFDQARGSGALAGAFEDECAAFIAALDAALPGDVIAVMCQADQDRMIDEIVQRGGREWASSA